MPSWTVLDDFSTGSVPDPSIWSVSNSASYTISITGGKLRMASSGSSAGNDLGQVTSIATYTGDFCFTVDVTSFTASLGANSQHWRLNVLDPVNGIGVNGMMIYLTPSTGNAWAAISSSVTSAGFSPSGGVTAVTKLRVTRVGSTLTWDYLIAAGWQNGRTLASTGWTGPVKVQLQSVTQTGTNIATIDFDNIRLDALVTDGIYWIDWVNGTDTIGTGTMSNPYKTWPAARSYAAGDEFRIAKTAAHTTYSGGIRFANNSASINRASGNATDLTTIFAVNGMIRSTYLDTLSGKSFWNILSGAATSSLTLGATYPGEATANSVTGDSCIIATQQAINATTVLSWTSAGKAITISGGWDLTLGTKTGQTFWRDTSTFLTFAAYKAAISDLYIVQGSSSPLATIGKDCTLTRGFIGRASAGQPQFSFGADASTVTPMLCTDWIFQGRNTSAIAASTPNPDWILDNCIVYVSQAFPFDAASPCGDLTFKNCTFNGATSIIPTAANYYYYNCDWISPTSYLIGSVYGGGVTVNAPGCNAYFDNCRILAPTGTVVAKRYASGILTTAYVTRHNRVVGSDWIERGSPTELGHSTGQNGPARYLKDTVNVRTANQSVYRLELRTPMYGSKAYTLPLTHQLRFTGVSGTPLTVSMYIKKNTAMGSSGRPTLTLFEDFNQARVSAVSTTMADTNDAYVQVQATITPTRDGTILADLSAAGSGNTPVTSVWTLALTTNKPNKMITAPNGNIWVKQNAGGSANGSRLAVVSPAGSLLTTITVASGTGLNDMTIDGAGNAWVAVQSSGKVYKYSQAGALLATITLSNPYKLFYDTVNDVLIVNQGYTTIIRYNSSGTLLTSYAIPAGTDHGGYYHGGLLWCFSNTTGVLKSCTPSTGAVQGTYAISGSADQLMWDTAGNLYVIGTPASLYVARINQAMTGAMWLSMSSSQLSDAFIGNDGSGVEKLYQLGLTALQIVDVANGGIIESSDATPTSTATCMAQFQDGSILYGEDSLTIKKMIGQAPMVFFADVEVS